MLNQKPSYLSSYHERTIPGTPVWREGGVKVEGGTSLNNSIGYDLEKVAERVVEIYGMKYGVKYSLTILK
jgi:hypothetical protein